MSDRRPEKLYAEHEDCGGSATLAQHDPRCDGYICHSTCPIPVPCECRCGHVEVDPVAVVRRGVESGTIKGEVVESVMDADADAWWVPVDSHIAPGDDAFDEPGRWFLVIPVSDGGSET